MALTDYKFWFIRRDDDGFITEAAVRFYEGGYNAAGEYVRSKLLGKIDLKHLDKKFVKDSAGVDTKSYTQADFGSIKTDDELCIFLNSELAKDTKRESIEGQKWLP